MIIADRLQEAQKLGELTKFKNWSQAAEKRYGKYQISVACARQADLCLLLDFHARSVVLVIGDKFGSMSFRLAKMVSQVCIAENDPESLQLLHARKDQEGTGRLQVVETDFSPLPFPDRFFDGIIVHRPGRHHSELVGEIARVLKAQGKVFMTGVSARGKLCRDYEGRGLCIHRKYVLLPSVEDPLYVVDKENPEAFPLLIQVVASQARRKSLFETWLFQLAVLAAKLFSLFRLHIILDFLPFLGIILSKSASESDSNRIEKIIEGISDEKRAVRPAYLFHTGLGLSTLLVKPHKSSEPEFILKVARDEHDESLRREHEILAYLHQAAPPHFLETIPKPIRVVSLGGQGVLCVTYLSGKPWDLKFSHRREIGFYFRAVRAWLTDLNAIPISEFKERSSRFREARARILTIAENKSGVPALQRALTFIEGNEISDLSSKVPLVINHRDLIPPHILFERRLMRVIDWGNCHYGYPLLDWVRFVLKTHAWIFHEKKIADVVANLLLGDSYLSALFYAETKIYCRDIHLNAELILPLFLLSLFDYLEGYFYFSDEEWCPHFEFLFRNPSWCEKLGLD